MQTRHGDSRWSGLRLVALATAWCAVPAADARADIVVFTTGRTMSVLAWHADGDLATLTLREGGEVRFPLAMVRSVQPDEVPYPVPASAALPALVAVAPPATAPDPALATRPFAAMISTAAARQGVEARLVHAVIEVESNYQVRARSTKGAKGLMQLMPGTARQYAVRDPYDPETNIDAGVQHLRRLMDRFDLPTALAAYNAGEATVLRYGGPPPFAETRAYVDRVLAKAGR